MADLERPVDDSEQVETCPQGHPWTEDNTYRSSATGSRMCRECVRDRHRRPLRVVSDVEETAWAFRRTGPLVTAGRTLY
jgi:hypothetical protein